MGATIALLAVGGALSILGVVLLRGGDRVEGDALDGPLAPGDPGADLAEVVLAARPAEAPFEGLTEVALVLDDRCVRVAVADEPDERGQGLRGLADLGPYAGMLFAYPDDGERTFTMAGVPVDLHVSFYAADGTPVADRRMLACPEGGSGCPPYPSGAPFRWALETPAGAAPDGPLRHCTDAPAAVVPPPG